MAKEKERIALLAACARNYLYMYGNMQSMVIQASNVTYEEARKLTEDNLSFLAQQEQFIQILERG